MRVSPFQQECLISYYSIPPNIASEGKYVLLMRNTLVNNNKSENSYGGLVIAVVIFPCGPLLRSSGPDKMAE